MWGRVYVYVCRFRYIDTFYWKQYLVQWQTNKIRMSVIFWWKRPCTPFTPSQTEAVQLIIFQRDAITLWSPPRSLCCSTHCRYACEIPTPQRNKHHITSIAVARQSLSSRAGNVSVCVARPSRRGRFDNIALWRSASVQWDVSMSVNGCNYSGRLNDSNSNLVFGLRCVSVAVI